MSSCCVSKCILVRSPERAFARGRALWGLRQGGSQRRGARQHHQTIIESRARLGLAVSRRLAERFQISRFAKRLCAKGIGKY